MGTAVNRERMAACGLLFKAASDIEGDREVRRRVANVLGVVVANQRST